ncbi:response regulator [Flavobacterium phragmitis]|uniref:CheY chemotaxis protein or a CheY-like REC (Receiver) domain n=1 Tax=Flavobacterium phragmitis TaxID=739143 RepID=A0A1I1LQB9_9FLAO|nr:response regulator [Flavobacterium phragmitis]SFC75185.1 CheY chemotaxis protein or a CheY-like REC (receiver) domain [Flavobacterium phragmitis]
MISSENSRPSAEGVNEKEPVKIILAEDDKDDQELFIDALDEAQVPSEVTTVENGQQLMDSLRDKSQPDPDIIFIDVNMPVKGGRQALEEIRGDKDFRDIPAVMISTWSHPSDIEESFEKGADLYVQKPNSFAGFVMVIKKVFFLHWAKALLRPAINLFFVSEKNTSQGDF